MPQIATESRSVRSSELLRFAKQLLLSVGVNEESSHAVADTLVESNLRGIDSHGISRLPHYLRRIQQGSIKPCPNLKFESLGPAIGRVDGDHGLGQIVMLKASREAVRIARSAGAGWVAVNNSSHCGALSYYGLQIADAGMVGIALTHVDPMVLPYGGKSPFCGTNPICIAAPRGPVGAAELPTAAFCLDMATSKTPWNSVANAAQEGVPIPLGWAVDGDGVDTTDASRVSALHAFGGYKGAGLGLAVDLLCSMLSGAPFGPDIPRMYGDLTQRRHLGGLVGAIDISKFTSLDLFYERMNDMLTRWSAISPVHSESPVRFPGEPEVIERDRRLRLGIPVGLQLLAELDGISDYYGVPPLDTDMIPEESVAPSVHSPDRSSRPSARGHAETRP